MSEITPLVSVVIIDLGSRDQDHRSAIESVDRQSYDNIEVIFVTMQRSPCRFDSSGLSKRLVNKIRYVVVPPDFSRSSAYGAGLQASKGLYLIFLQPSDQMLSSCIEAHINAQQRHPGRFRVSTVDVITSWRGQDVRLFSQEISHHMRSGLKSLSNEGWRSTRKSSIELSDQCKSVFIGPMFHGGSWIWPDLSANCVQREAAQMLLAPSLEFDRVHDINFYLLCPLVMLFGSLIIDCPLVRQKRHTLALTSDLGQGSAFDFVRACEDGESAIKNLITSALAKPEPLYNARAFIQALQAIILSIPTGTKTYLQNVVNRKLAEEQNRLERVFGAFDVAEEFRRMALNNT